MDCSVSFGAEYQQVARSHRSEQSSRAAALDESTSDLGGELLSRSFDFAVEKAGGIDSGEVTYL